MGMSEAMTEGRCGRPDEGREGHSRWNMTVNVVDIAFFIAAMVASPLLGTLGDRHGHRLVLAVSTAAYVFAAGLAIVAHHGFMMYPIFALAAVHVGAQMIAFRNVVYELAPVDRRPSYVALASLAPAPAALAFPVLGGWLAQRASWGYAAAFGLSAALCAAAWLVLMTRVHMRAGPALVAPEVE
jgi:MFS family permease